jgi:AAA domain
MYCQYYKRKIHEKTIKIMNNQQKGAIAELILKEVDKLGSQAAVARKFGISASAVTTGIKKQKYDTIAPEEWARFAQILGYNLVRSGWKIAETYNAKRVANTLGLAQTNAMFFVISEKAGSGKSAGIEAFKNANYESVIVLECKEWGRAVFLRKLAQEVGIVFDKPTTPAWRMAEEITEFFKTKSATTKPLLVLDEADKLAPGALRFIIGFYNDLEDQVGMVISGTEYLEKMIKNGVKRSSKGFDELDSRFGRNYVHLSPSSFADVQLICEANGINNETDIAKIWNEMPKVASVTKGKAEPMVSDLRLLKKKIQKVKLILKQD